MKYHFDGIGSASASVIMAALGANPSTTFLTAGLPGRIVFWIAKYFCMLLANSGLIVLNVGAAKIQDIIDEGNFNESWDTAENIINKIRDTGKEMTDEEIKAIDQPVIDAFRRFASFGRDRKN